MSGIRPVGDHTVVGTAAWVERDQFVYFVTMERELGVPGDWNEFRHGLVSALTAAFGLDTIWLDLPEPVQRHQVQCRRDRAYAVVDEVRARHDPATDWDGFFDALWAARHRLRRAG